MCGAHSLQRAGRAISDQASAAEAEEVAL
jgi:hypothetical protein